ncbi:MAG: SCO6880 family protein [Sporichthyaceae bacterium]
MSVSVASERRARESAAVPRYSGWQRERLGFLFGLSGPQFALASLALLCAAAPISTRSLAVLVIAWPAAALFAALIWIRVLGETSTEWLVIAVSFTLNKAAKRNVFLSGAFAPRGVTDPAEPAPMDLPGPLAALRFLDAETGGLLAGTDGACPRIAVVHHPLDQTYTAVAAIRYPGIALSDTDRRESRVGGWGGLLAQLCSEASPFTRIAVVQRTVPDDGTALRRWHTDSIRPDAPAVALEAVETLITQSVVSSAAHEAWIVLSLDATRARAQIRGAGGGDVGALAVLVRQLSAVSSAIGGAHLEITRWLAVRELAEVVRTAFDPTSTGPLSTRRSVRRPTDHPEALAPGVDLRLAGPAAAEARWGSYRHDSGLSVTYHVQEWPRVGVPAWFLRPVLTAQHCARRSFALHVEPVAPRAAEKAVMRARTKRTVAVGLRRKSGQLVPEHERQALLEAEDQDRQRAEGHGLVRFVAYLTVTVTDPALLDLACSELETDAAQCGLEVRRLWGAQDVGFFAAAMPLGLGLPKTRGAL